MDKKERKELVKKKTPAPNIISVGITWVDGRILFKKMTKWAIAWYGICHYSEGIFAITPADYQYPTMVTTILASPADNYCEKAGSCLHFKCILNRFHKGTFMKEFKGCGPFTLGLPHEFGVQELWFNSGKWKQVWKDMIIPIEGGILKFDESKKSLIV